MKFMKRATAVLVSLAVACSCALPTFAEGAQAGVQKDENVFLILNEDGSVKQQIVSDWLHSDSGVEGLADRSTLLDIQNLKSDALPRQDGETLLWSGEGNDVYYQGTTDQTPPVTVEIRYALDGQAKTADELEGRSGHLVMTIALTNHESSVQTIAGAERTVYTPFFTVVAADLPVGTFSNIAAQHGTVQTDASNQLVCFLALPGMAETFDGLLTGEFSSVQDYLLDEVTLEADVTDFKAPAVMLAAAADPEALSAEVDVPDLSGQMGELTDATAQLQEGSAALAQATGVLQEKMNEFAAQYATFDAGVDSALTGAQQVKEGAQSLLAGAQQLTAGSGTLAEGAGRLRSGSAQLALRLNDQLVPGLTGAAAQKAALEQQMETLSGELDTLVLPDAAALKTQLGDGVGQTFDAALSTGATAAASSVAAGVESGCKTAADGALAAAAPQAAQAVADTAAGLVGDSLAQSLAGTGLPQEQIDGIIAAAQSAAAGAGAADITTSLQGAVNGAIDSNVTVDASAVASQIAASGQAQAGRAAAVSQVTAALDGLDTASLQALLGEFKNLSASAQTMLGSIDALTEKLYNAQDPADAQTVVGAANALAAGAADAQAGAADLYAGAQSLTAGTVQLSDGAGSLQAGLTQLSGASKTVKDAIGQFQTGVAGLADGGRTLSDGMDTYAVQAIGRLTGLVDADALAGLGETLEAVQRQARQYTSYTGAADGTVCTVKFVMKTDSSVQAQQTSTAAEKAGTDAKAETTLWERVKNLFA